MQGLTVPRRWTSQPQIPVGIDWSNPINRGLCVAWSPNGAIGSSYVDRLGASTGSALGFANGTAGVGVGETSGSRTTNAFRLSATANRTDTAYEVPSAAVTVMAFVQQNGANANGLAPIFSNSSPNTAPFTAWGLIGSTNGTFNFDFSAGGTVRSLSTNQVITGSPTAIFGTYDGATAKAFVRGKQNNSAAFTGNIVYPSSADRGPAIGNFYNYTGSARSFNGIVFCTALWNRALSDAEVASLSANPWQIFAPSL